MKLSDLTPRAQQVMALAREEAGRLNHSYVGTEHLLLGSIALGGQGLSVNVLRKQGLDLETVRKEVEKMSGCGAESTVVGSIPFTPRIKEVPALAQEEAKALNHSMVGTEHILLGLLRESEGPAHRVFHALGLNIEDCRGEILQGLAPYSKSSQ